MTTPITEDDLQEYVEKMSTVNKWRRVAIGGLIVVLVSTAIVVPLIFLLNKNNKAE